MCDFGFLFDKRTTKHVWSVYDNTPVLRVNQITAWHLLEDARTHRTSVTWISRRLWVLCLPLLSQEKIYIFLIKQLEVCEDTFTVRNSLLIRLIFSKKNGAIHKKRLSTRGTTYLTVHLFCCGFSFHDVFLNHEKV